MPTLRELHAEVTTVILEADYAAARARTAAARQAVCQLWRRVAALEAEIAAQTGAETTEGAIARTGAVQATIKGGDPALARALAQRYLAEPGLPATVAVHLRLLARDA